MKAAVFYAKKDIRIENAPEPQAPKAGEVKIKVAWCGICGSDLHEYLHGPMFIPAQPHPLTGRCAPLIIGHEFSGTVVEVGEGVDTVRIGDLVAPNPCLHCGVCEACRSGNYNVCEKLAFTGIMTDGAFAEFVNVPAQLCSVLPSTFNLENAAVIEPLSIGYKAVRRAGNMLGKKAVVFGAGTIGLGTLMCAKAAGAMVITVEMSEARKQLAKECGADVVLDPKECNVVDEIRKITEGGADVSFECIGNKITGPQAIEVLRNTGITVLVGMFPEASTFNLTSISFTDKTATGSCASTIDDFNGVIQLINGGQLKTGPLITGKIKLDDLIEKGFEELVNNADKNIKIIVSAQ